MICCSIVLILLFILSLASVFKTMFGNKSSIDFNGCLGFKDWKASACFVS